MLRRIVPFSSLVLNRVNMVTIGGIAGPRVNSYTF